LDQLDRRQIRRWPLGYNLSMAVNNPLSVLRRAYQIVNFQDVPVYRAQAWALLDAQYHGQHFTLTSGDRRESTLRWFNHTYGTDLHSQAYLYSGFERGLPGFLPANPPDRGTHLLLGDGVVGALHEHLQPWQLGIDCVSAGESNDCGPLVAWLNRSGYDAYRPYPSGSEAHHFCFGRSPVVNARKRLGNYYRVRK
jgi:hypothetical protein